MQQKKIIEFVSCIQRRDYTLWTKQDYKKIIKRFYKWLKGDDKIYPDEVSWINADVKRSELNLPGEGDLLTEDDIKKLINAANHPRDKALISMLYESGCRITELGGLRISDVKFDKYGVVIAVRGKTGSRKIRLVSSTPYLMTWLNIHPFKHENDSPLWINIGTKAYNKPVNYNGILRQIKSIARKAGVNKRCNPHLFRHSRATYMANHLTEFQMNQYFGWIQGSSMPSTYVHLSGKEINNAILKLNGVETEEKEEKSSNLRPKNCHRCETINSYDSKYCSICAAPLDIETAMKMEERRRIPDELMTQLIKDPEVQKILLEKIGNMNIKV